MFVGQRAINSIFEKTSPFHPKTQSPQIVQAASLRAAQPKTDTVEIRAASTRQQSEAGLYGPHGNQMRTLDHVSATQLAPDPALQAELLPASEQTSYTARDALMNQYLKQSRIDGYFEGDTFVRTSDKPVTLILASEVTDAELARFAQQLQENGLGEEIDWRGVKEDFARMGIGLDNAARVETKAEYLASRYAVLKDRIQSQYTGAQQSAQMDQLARLYADAKEDMADTYANSIGGFYEALGQDGAAADMKASVLAMVDEKAALYETQLAQADLGAALRGTDAAWLLQDDAYMAAQLREHAAALPTAETQTTSGAPYNAAEIRFAGAYANALSTQREQASQVWDTTQDDSALGEYFAAQQRATQQQADQAGVRAPMLDLINKAFAPYMNQFMDALDQQIEKNRTIVAQHPWMQGSMRTEHMDRNRVHQAFQAALATM